MTLSLIPLPYRILAIAAVALAVIIGGMVWLDGVKDTAFKAGVTSSEKLHAEALVKANTANRESEALLRADLDDYARRFEVLSNQRQAREQVIVTRIEDRLTGQPNCSVDPSIIALRNEIRGEG